MRRRRLALAGAASLLAATPSTVGHAQRYDPGPVVTTRLDPLRIDDDDFARHRDPADWRGIAVAGIRFTEERARWRLFRLVNRRRPTGPLWFVPHDNENAGFEAGLAALRRYGGTMIVVDTPRDRRLNSDVATGPPIDPNRNFHDGLPRYARAVLAALNRVTWPIIALHSNAPGYDPRDSSCPPLGDTHGSGIISIHYCDAVLTPRASIGRAYPFDDDDTVAFATWSASGRPDDAFCTGPMTAADFNVVHERVVDSDGSLSNYAVLHHLGYLNFETRDDGDDPAALAGGRDRLAVMIDLAMRTCARPAARPPGRPRLHVR